MIKDFSEKMIKIYVKGLKQFYANHNENLQIQLAKNGIIPEALCGGRGTCGKCKIKILSGKVCDRNGEIVYPGDDGNHLACQVYPLTDLIIDPLNVQGVTSKGEVRGLVLEQSELDPFIRKIVFQPKYPDLKNIHSFQEMIQLSEGVVPLNSHSIKDLAETVLSNPKQITLTIFKGEVTAVEKGDTSEILFGVAFDIGTTTVAGMLVDINKGEIISAAAETNPQASFGADVISRINYAGNPGGLEQLSSVIINCLNNLISNLCFSSGISPNDIYLATVAGNSTMEHLLMRISPSSLAQSPYVPVFNYIPPFIPGEINLAINPHGRVMLLPNLASFVGADTVAAIVAVQQDLKSDLTLLIDLGTNGEIVLGNKDRLLVCSTAAGPAFEGAQLSCGMRAAAGAIVDVIVKDDIYFTALDEEKPKGICGSGIIKAIAELFNAGLIDSSGRLLSSDYINEAKIKKRLSERNGQKVFILVPSHESATGEDIYITQGDIREIQLVKSSICTGVEILIETLGTTVEEVDQVLIAGAFGNYVDLDSALAIGLLPLKFKEKLRLVGNAAGLGTVKSLLSQECLKRCNSLVKKAEFIELANNPAFQDKFIDNLSFPVENQ